MAEKTDGEVLSDTDWTSGTIEGCRQNLPDGETIIVNENGVLEVNRPLVRPEEFPDLKQAIYSTVGEEVIIDETVGEEEIIVVSDISNLYSRTNNGDISPCSVKIEADGETVTFDSGSGLGFYEEINDDNGDEAGVLIGMDITPLIARESLKVTVDAERVAFMSVVYRYKELE